MPQFDADTVVDPIRIRLHPYVQGFDWTVIPEPSDQQIGEFLSGLKRVTGAAKEALGVKGDIDVTDPDQVQEAMENLEPEEFVKAAADMAEIHAALCAGPPGSVPVVTKADLLAVPLRKRMLLYAWLQGEVLNPEAAPGAGNAQVRTLPRAAAG